ncbi:MAG: hypothetical protein UHS32_00140, partial [Bacteroidaceae bacterium]|nr:hypothetical protein [Bacteroidaceae bacterium]
CILFAVPQRYHIKWYWSTKALVLECYRLDTAVSAQWYCGGKKSGGERATRCNEKVMPLRCERDCSALATATACTEKEKRATYLTEIPNKNVSLHIIIYFVAEKYIKNI